MSLLGQTKADPDGEALERLLVVTSGPVKLALSAPLVEGMLPLGNAGTKDVMTIRGITYRVMPLAARWDRTPAPAPFTKLLLLCGYHGLHRGYTVDQALGLTEVNTRQIRPLPPHFACEERTWFNGFFLFRNTIALRVNPDWLFEPGTGEDEAESIRELEIIDAERAE